MKTTSIRLFCSLALACTILAAVAGVAGAVGPIGSPPYIYWSNALDNEVTRSSIPNGSSQPLISGLNQPDGVAVDRSTGRVYVVAGFTGPIESSASDGSDVQPLDVGLAPVDGPSNPVVDGRRGRLYWANDSSNSIGWASLDGSGTGGVLDTGGADLYSPSATAIDPTTDRIYWTNADTTAPGNHPISWAALDGSGASGSFGTSNGATYGLVSGLTIDPIGQKLYFTDLTIPHLYEIGTDGTGEQILTAAQALVDSPTGAAFDPSSGRVYMANSGPSGVNWFKPADGTSGSVYAVDQAAIGNPAVAGAGEPVASAGASISTDVGTSTTQSVTITNSGDYALEIYAIGQPAAFSLAAGGTCANHVIVVGGSCQQPVTFRATVSGTQSAQLTFVTDAGSFDLPVTGIGTETIFSKLSTSRRCAAPQNAGALSAKFNLNRAQNLKAKLVRQQGAHSSSSCPARSTGGGKFSGAVTTADSASLAGKSGSQTRTLKQIFGTKKLAPGHYRLQLSYTGADNVAQRRTTWFWVTGD